MVQENLLHFVYEQTLCNVKGNIFMIILLGFVVSVLRAHCSHLLIVLATC